LCNRYTFAVIQHTITTDRQHGVIDICQPDFACATCFFKKKPGQISSSTCDIEHFIPGFGTADIDRKPLPQAVQSHGHEIVHQIVACCYRVKHFRNLAGFFRFRDGCETKVCGIRHSGDVLY